MNRRSFSPSGPSLLAVLVECTVAPMLREHAAPILFELNIDTSLKTNANSEHLISLLQSLVHDSLREMQDGGELTISACQTANGVELEIADTGSDAENRSHSISIAAASLGCKPHWQNCPQGGAAVTLILPFSNAARKAA